MAFIIADRVKETSTTTGTGALTLAGAITGFSTFASRCSVGDTCYYAIQTVDASGVSTGDWECGLGTYSGANTLTRTTVTSSSASDAAVSFAAGDKQVYITVPAVQAAWARERLTAARTYYVRTDGSDTNTGLADTAGGAFLTVQKAVDVVSGTLDLDVFDVTVQLGDGTRTEAVVLKPYIGAGIVTIQGNAGTPSNVVMSTTSDHCFSMMEVGKYTIKDMQLQTTTTGFGVVVSGTGSTLNHSNLVFGACAEGHLYADGHVKIKCTGNYSIIGSAPVHAMINMNAIMISPSITVTLTGTPAFATAYMSAAIGAIIYASGCTYSGSATGKRYAVMQLAIIETSAGTLPGSIAGTTASGGQYN